MRRVLFITIALIPFALFSQEFGKVSGKIVAKESGKPLAGASVTIVGTDLGSAADENGDYVILGVPVGSHTLEANYIGYQSVKISGVYVSKNLTTKTNFELKVSAVQLQALEIVAEKPLINQNTTNTTRIITTETIDNLPLRGVESIVALQTGTVADNGNIYVRGSRAGDVAYYVDGVYMNNAWDLDNTSTVSNAAVEEIQFQSGGFSAEYGNVNGGVVSTTTRTGGDEFSLNAEIITGLGKSSASTSSGLYSYGYNLYNMSFGGSASENIKYFINFEGRKTDDPTPNAEPFYAIDRTEVDSLNTPGFDVIDESVRTILVDGTPVQDTVYAGYSNFRSMYGPKPNSGSDKFTLTGNLLFKLGDLRFKVGGLMTSDKGNNYSHDFSLVNSSHNPKYDESANSFYANMTYSLSANSYVKLNLSFFNYQHEEGDVTHWDDYNSYGAIGSDTYLRDFGTNPVSIQEFAEFSGYGSIYDDYSINKTSYYSVKGDYLNQFGNHEFKAGFDYRNNTIEYYRLAQPLEIAQRVKLAQDAGTPMDDQWVYLAYMNAYAENLGYSIDGKGSGTAYQDPGNPIIAGMYVNDKIELEDMILNVGLRYDYFNSNTQAAADWNDIWITNGRIDRDLSNFKDVKAQTYISPRIGFSFPVTDRTKFHSQYGKYIQQPILDRLYLADSRLAANLSQGNMTVSPNPSLKPERTTQYEVGFTQQLGSYAALDITGYYKEVRDYTMMANLQGAMKNGSPFIWAQYQNGDFGVVKGLSFNLNMRRVNGLMANVNYTLSFAEGTGSDPASNWNIAWTGDTYPTLVNPVEYDQRHTGSIMLDYRVGDNGSILANSGVNLLFQFGSGTAYTPSIIQSDVFGRGWYAPVAAINSAYKPWTQTLDMKLDHDITLGKYRANIYLWVTNLLDTKNVDDVYQGTGDAATDGYLSTQEGKVWATGNPDIVDFYNAQLRDPRNWDAPRQVRLGINFEL
ncbi:MAG: TonB-dependent receptor [FCB group bacterium]|nr:TonB-dependent receptor [FCB group bacterium]